MEKYKDVEIKILSKNVIILKGGLDNDEPTKYMDGAVKYVCGLLGIDKYNQFIENYLDNPWIRILIFNFNDIEFKKLDKTIINNF